MQRLRRHLNVAALAQPVEKALGLRANQRIAFRMRDDRAKAGELQFVQGLIERRRNRIVGKFHEQIVFLVERKAGGVVPDVLKIFEAEVEIAAGRENQAPLEARLKFVPALLDQFRDKRMARSWRAECR